VPDNASAVPDGFTLFTDFVKVFHTEDNAFLEAELELEIKVLFLIIRSQADLFIDGGIGCEQWLVKVPRLLNLVIQTIDFISIDLLYLLI
jgi:hypothetical protein